MQRITGLCTKRYMRSCDPKFGLMFSLMFRVSPLPGLWFSCIRFPTPSGGGLRSVAPSRLFENAANIRLQWPVLMPGETEHVKFDPFLMGARQTCHPFRELGQRRCCRGTLGDTGGHALHLRVNVAV